MYIAIKVILEIQNIFILFFFFFPDLPGFSSECLTTQCHPEKPERKTITEIRGKKPYGSWTPRCHSCAPGLAQLTCLGLLLLSEELMPLWSFPPPVALAIGLLARRTATSLTPRTAFSMPCKSEPLIWPPASWQGRWERSTALGYNPSNLFLNAVSCEKKSYTGEAFVIQIEHLPGLLPPPRTWVLSCPDRELGRQTLYFPSWGGNGLQCLLHWFLISEQDNFHLEKCNSPRAPPQLSLWTMISALLLPALRIFLVSLWVILNHS